MFVNKSLFIREFRKQNFPESKNICTHILDNYGG